ncbi:hypothetical protein Patl1_20038 [Pistacia atlantica]|uniref:Uncharacterized protein n=1 Tax=Pistacia atlantica TaxID=434234 RepID=A0ACC1BII2_9ROSI|nr:hypothetical protein Patl1_20038 [Pistacia atlantica]
MLWRNCSIIQLCKLGMESVVLGMERYGLVVCTDTAVYAEGLAWPTGGAGRSDAQSDYFVFHSPYNKLLQKSFARLYFNDFLRNARFVS